MKINKLILKNYFQNNNQEVICIFHFHSLMSVKWNFPPTALRVAANLPCAELPEDPATPQKLLSRA